LGASAVELDIRDELHPARLSDSGVRELRKLISDFDLQVSAVSFRTRRGYATEDELARRVDATKAAMRMAFALGTETVINHIGQIPTDRESLEYKVLVEVLSDLGRYGHHVGARLAADTGADDGAELASLLEVLPPEALGVNFSPGNLVRNGFSPSEALRRLAPYVVHVHANDAVRDLSRGADSTLPLGQGSADFPALAGILEQHDYRGWFTITCSGSQNPLADMENAIEYLKNL
jgi:sugar phosphate isomerase/epimerase